jgi:hypothetical protein
MIKTIKKIASMKNHSPKSIGFINGILMSESLNAGKKFVMMVDENKARKILETIIKEGRQIKSASLGLDGDWDCNNTEIFDGVEFQPYDSYDGSMWAIPKLIIYFEDGSSEAHECWKRQDKEGEVL